MIEALKALLVLGGLIIILAAAATVAIVICSAIFRWDEDRRRVKRGPG